MKMREKSFCPAGSARSAAPAYRNGRVGVTDKQARPVCLLDDDPSVLKAASRLLDSAGWKVKPFTDPFAFLEYATTSRPRVALIDIRMPTMNGLEVQTRLRSISPSTRVIILTSNDDPSVRSRAMEGGAFAFFVKSETNGDLLARIASALNGG
jgi:FixJ family two-component response regulator